MSRKEKMKVYHGIPKSVTDEHTVFYASFDGVCPSEFISLAYRPCPTGYGANLSIDSKEIILQTPLQNKFTIEFNLSNFVATSSPKNIFVLTDDSDITLLRIIQDINNKLGIHYGSSENHFIYMTSTPVNGVLDTTFTHIRLTVNDDNLTVYVNGTRYNLPITKNIGLYGTATKLKIRDSKYGKYEGTVSDLHISNIDRGDYFPNLPQDFIEGKAVIKPRMSQQQIKGDPLYSQVTELRVPHNVNLTGNYNREANSDGTFTHKQMLELSCNGASKWNSGAILKIKGLNGEVISGVIDTDTALGRILSVTKLTDNSARVTCDCFSKISNGDTLNFANINSFHTNSWVDNGFWGVVSELNSSSNSFVVTTSNGRATIPTEGDFILETTTTSSSPVVKAEDGTAVVGTWSGLGTNEATFTLGTNTDLAGQDLYVTYSLNIPSGNSDFSELPYSVDRAYNEVGLEMKPVSEIVIEDDFKGKVSGDTDLCPHYSSFYAKETLAPPEEFKQDSYMSYSALSAFDNKIHGVSNGNAGKIPQQLFSFNIIEIVERKLGCEIPSRDKVQWLKDNLERIDVSIYSYGSCPEGNYCLVYIYKSSAWKSDYVTPVTKNTPTLISFNIVKANAFYRLDDCITDDGFVHALLTTKPSDGTTPSILYTDYASIKVKLLIDSTFTTLYCNNTRAREDSCNPVLIQKETKTVKRYLPSKECFVTEVTNYPYNTKHLTQVGGEYLAIQKTKVVTSNGTGSYVTKEMNGSKSSHVDKVPLPINYKWYQMTNECLQIDEQDLATNSSHSVNLPIVRYWGGKRYVPEGVTSSGLDSCKTLSIKSDKDGIKMFEFYGALKKYNNELLLTIMSSKRHADNFAVPDNPSVWSYKLPNRPLIK